MKTETKKIVKKIVNDYYSCEKCSCSDVCVFMNGSDNAKYIAECDADAFAEGIHATLSYLASIPWDKAIHIIADSSKEDEQ